MLPQQRDQILLDTPHHGIVMPLIHARLQEPFPLTDFNDALDLIGPIIRETKLFELAFGMRLIDGFQRLFPRRLALRNVQKHRLDAINAEVLQRFLNAGCNGVAGMPSRRGRRSGHAAENLSMDREAGWRVDRPQELLGAGIVGGCVQVGVASRVEGRE